MRTLTILLCLTLVLSGCGHTVSFMGYRMSPGGDSVSDDVRFGSVERPPETEEDRARKERGRRLANDIMIGVALGLAGSALVFALSDE